MTTPFNICLLDKVPLIKTSTTLPLHLIIIFTHFLTGILSISISSDIFVNVLSTIKIVLLFGPIYKPGALFGKLRPFGAVERFILSFPL